MPESPKMSLALETFWGLSGPRLRRLLAPSLIDFRGNPGIRALYQTIPKGPKIDKKNQSHLIQSRLKCSIPEVQNSPHEKGAFVGGLLEFFNLACKFQASRGVILIFFSLWALRYRDPKTRVLKNAFKVRKHSCAWEEPSMDQCRSQGKLSTNFQGLWSIQIFPENNAPTDWSIRISPEIHVEQWLPDLSDSAGLHRHRSIECSSMSTVKYGNCLRVGVRS